MKRFDESKVGSVHGAYVGDVELRLRGPIEIFAIPKFGAQPPISDCPARPRHVNLTSSTTSTSTGESENSELQDEALKKK